MGEYFGLTALNAANDLLGRELGRIGWERAVRFHLAFRHWNRTDGVAFEVGECDAAGASRG